MLQAGNNLFFFGATGKRPLKFAGSWYQAEADKLDRDMQAYAGYAAPVLEKQLRDKRQILAIVAPHAGYMYSGKTAACSYLPLKGKGIKRVFLLGPSHYKGFHGAALTRDKAFATVYGELKCDTEILDDLKDNILFQDQTEAHHQEHSLEMQLAFVRATFGDVKIVPLLIGKLDNVYEAEYIAGELSSHLRDGDLIVVSSDFTHIGPRFAYQPFEGDKDWRAELKEMDMEAAGYLERRDLDGFFQFYKRTDDTICGIYSLFVMLALLPSDARGTLLDYSTSQTHTAEDDDNSVSYMSLVFSSDKSWSELSSKSQKMVPLSQEEKEVMLRIARRTLEVFVRTGRSPSLEEIERELNIVVPSRLNIPHGVFVTLYKRDSGQKNLRGCIGYIFPIKSLCQGIVDNTISAASKDPRFLPVAPSELESLTIDINVLTAPHKVASYKDIVIGEDGILLKARGRQSVFLPSVATEFGWGVEETLTQLSLKAGLSAEAWRQDARFEVFRSESFEE